GNGEGEANINLDKLLKKMSDIGGGEVKAKGKGSDKEGGWKSKAKDKGLKEGKEGAGSLKPTSGGVQDGGKKGKRKDKGRGDALKVEAIAGEK
ncbi:hypothetical protein FRC11_002401, partial [Ceratobasidium sp. 423]